MYFNVSQLTPCVLIIISVKMTNNYQRLYTKMNFRLSPNISRGNSYSDIGFCQDHCNYALVPHPPQNRKQFGKGFVDISVIFTVVPTPHSPCFLWPSTLKVKVTRDSAKVCHGMYMVNSNFNMFSRDVTVLMLFNSVSHLVL